MNIGDYIRVDNNIYQFKGYCDCHYCISRGFKEPILRGLNDNMYIYNEKDWNKFLADKQFTVSSRPRELIEVGDLYELTSNMTNRKHIFQATNDDSIFKIIKSGSKDIKLVTKILTPNSNGGYDLQWSKEE